MSTTQGEQLSWEDIQALYTQLINTRAKFGSVGTAITIPSNPGKVTTNYLDDIVTFINNTLLTERHLTSQAKIDTSTLDPVPGSGELVKPNYPQLISDKLTALNNICYFDSGCFGFGFFKCFCSFNEFLR